MSSTASAGVDGSRTPSGGNADDFRGDVVIEEDESSHKFARLSFGKELTIECTGKTNVTGASVASLITWEESPHEAFGGSGRTLDGLHSTLDLPIPIL